jgi:phage anti-repressor protein
MQELVKVVTDANGKQVVSARELYDVLGYDKSQWARWYKKNIEDNAFAIEKEDWEGFDTVSSSNNGSMTKDFAITLDFAKRISMMARTRVGEEIRNYFIACEDKLKEISVPKTLSEALYLAAKQAETIEQQAEQLKLQEPKVEFAEQLLSATNSLDFGTSAKALQLPFGRNKMFEICRELGFLMNNNQPYQSYINSGYFTLLETSFIHPISGDRVLTTKTMITAKGQNWLMGIFKKNGLI